ncbi:PD40 domain-containing protein [Desulfobulbus alkaliphilus]|uniref:PD40 domain-containing protein n=1 Tax=Desulfobulbus alkaliphilus TaxID=869814 RepID=UPI00196590DA|nr:PD40 domain-containing protein [Desulfobulbus alkaliphilus]MBM9535730.1 PD40 domain-containing protein [Desulfobulbus alkaliphilus]
MHTKFFIPVWTAITCLLLLLPVKELQAERLYFDITATDIRKIVLAVPDFTTAPGQQNGAAAASLLAQGFALHSFLDVIDTERYGGRRDASWRMLGVDYVIMGKIEPDPAGVMIEGQILDVATGQMLAGRRYRGTEAQFDDMVLRLCDDLIEDFTGEMGVSRTSIAYVSDGTGHKEVYVADILGRNPRQVTRHRALCVSPRFTPDGRYLAYSTYHRGNQDLYITDLRQSATTTSLSRRPGMNLAPAFMPDGQTMVVTLSQDGNPDLYLLDRQGKILERLTSRSGINVSPSLTSDGRMLAFASDRTRSGRPRVYIMDMQTRQTRLLQNGLVESSEPAWSPQGDEIAFTGLVDGRYHLFISDRNGANVRQVTSGRGDFESPTWSPDGRQLAVTRKIGGRSEICVVGKNGRDIRVLFRVQGNQSYPQWSPRLP